MTHHSGSENLERAQAVILAPRRLKKRGGRRGFPHFVADGGEEGVGRDLAGICAEIWKDAAPAHVVDVAVFCDSDDTHTASINYFAYVRLERPI